MATFPIGDFSGGLTDSIYSSPENCAEVADNVLIRKDKSLETAPGIEAYSSIRIPGGKRIAAFRWLDEDLIAFTGTRAYHVTPTAITEILGPTSNKAFNLGDDNSIVSIADFNNQIVCTNDAYSYPIKLYKDNANALQLRTAGLPVPSSAPSITGNGSNAFAYAFVYSYEYRVGNTLFQDISAPVYVSITNGGASNAISGMPGITNGVDFNYDVTVIKMKIYRTVHTGSSFYYVGEVLNGVTNYTDTVTDSVLRTRETLYTNGGILPNDPPPQARYIFEANDTYNYLDIIQASEKKPHVGIQSVAGDPDSVPESFFRSFKKPLKGGGAVGRSRIVFTESEVLRLDGQLDELGRGAVGREVVSNTVGCVSSSSIVKSSRGLYFAAMDGFYFTDGFGMPTKLARKDAFSSKIDRIYKDLVLTATQQKRIQGVYDALNNRVLWIVQKGNPDTDMIFVYDETQDAFTTISSTSGIFPSALIMSGEDIIIGDTQGYIFKMSKDYYTHPVVDTSSPISSWITAPVMYRWKSIALSMGNGSVNKWISKINTQGSPDTNLTMAIRSYTNGEAEYKELYPLRIVPGLVWGDPAFVWGDDAFMWGRTSTLNQTRKFPSGRMRARHRQIEFTNAYFTLGESTTDPDSFITISAGLNTASLVDPSNYTFGVGNELYDLTVGGKTYVVLSGTEDTLVLDDPEGTLVDGTYSWNLSGYGKGQRAHIRGLSLDYEYLSDAGTFWQGSDK